MCRLIPFRTMFPGYAWMSACLAHSATLAVSTACRIAGGPTSQTRLPESALNSALTDISATTSLPLAELPAPPTHSLTLSPTAASRNAPPSHATSTTPPTGPASKTARPATTPTPTFSNASVSATPAPACSLIPSLISA